LQSTKTPLPSGVFCFLMHLPRSSTQLSVAVLGTVGSYHHQVAVALFPNALVQYFASFGDVVGAVCRGEVQKGIVAIANSTIGTLPAPQAVLHRHAQEVTTETQYTLPITHGLVVAAPTMEEGDILTVVSHAAALQQCQQMIQARGWHQRVAMDTATAVKEIMAHPTPHIAAIASPFAARLYGAHLLPTSIQDQAENATTFAVIRGKSG
jgi:prephenate dehydratase